jgi:group I intron endonuclease
MNSFGVIYKATNKLNGMIYIGQTTVGLSVRKKKHIRDSRKDNTRIFFHRAINKYGIDNFSWEIIEYCNSKDELDDMEFHYIIQYDSFDNGYNMTINTSCQSGKFHPNYGNVMSDKSKKRLSALAKKRFRNTENHPMFGKKHSDVTRAKLRAARNNRPPISDDTRTKMSILQTGRKHSDESKLKCSISKIGKNNPFYGKTLTDDHKNKIATKMTGEDNHFYGKKHSEETRSKMRESWRLRKLGVSVGEK